LNLQKKISYINRLVRRCNWFLVLVFPICRYTQHDISFVMAFRAPNLVCVVRLCKASYQHDRRIYSKQWNGCECIGGWGSYAILLIVMSIKMEISNTQSAIHKIESSLKYYWLSGNIENINVVNIGLDEIDLFPNTHYFV
jgi:hypothetical protein